MVLFMNWKYSWIDFKVKQPKDVLIWLELKKITNFSVRSDPITSDYWLVNWSLLMISFCAKQISGWLFTK